MDRSLKTVTATYGSDFQMQRRMLRVTTGIQKVFFGFLGRPNLCQNLALGVLFPEVGAQPALTISNV